MPTKQTIVRYTCNVCQTEYETRKEAKACEQMPVEETKYKVGDYVQAVLEKFNCSNCGAFTPAGRITAATCLRGNDGLTQDYINKWLPGTEAQTLLGRLHLHQYGMEYSCPKCGQSWVGTFFTAELK